MTAYYNEFDPFAAAWLRELITDGLIAPGDVDERSIVEVQPDDLKGYTQCHFFAGIGGWSLALRLAEWGDTRPVWTGSCPCQPFSVAGKRGGHTDERHLWPEFYRLIAECRPATVFGEQVASKVGREWLAAVRLDLEGAGYAVGGADLPAASVGAPHKRSRLWFVGAAGKNAERIGWRGGSDGGTPRNDGEVQTPRLRPTRGVADRQQSGLEGHAGDERDGHEPGRKRADPTRPVATGGPTRGVADTAHTNGRPGERRTQAGIGADGERGRGSASGGADNNPWADLVWLPCRDGKARPTQPGLFPLAYGIPNRVGTLRGAGNAIVPQVAAAFIQAFCEAIE